MSQDHTTTPMRVWHDSAHASLCVLGSYLCGTDFFAPLEHHLQIHQKTLKYTPVQKLEMFLVALLAGAKAVSQTKLTLGVDAAHSPSLWLARLCRSVGDCRHPQCGHRR
jgi:hypothetical protein